MAVGVSSVLRFDVTDPGGLAELEFEGLSYWSQTHTPAWFLQESSKRC